MVFLYFDLPNPTAWFYLSLMLAVGLFFKFNRFFSLRNWDLLSLYLLVPGFLFLQHAFRIERTNPMNNPASLAPARWAFIWLMAGSGWFFLRCLLDMTLTSRPSLAPNLNVAGLAWFSGAMFVCMIPVAIRTADPEGGVGRKTAGFEVLDKAGTQTVDKIQQIAGEPGASDGSTHFWVQRSTSLIGHLAVFAALVLIGAIHFQNVTAGMAAGTFYLILPYTAYHVHQAHHVLPAALLIWAVYGYRRAWLSGLLLGLATGMFFFPLVVVPVWMSFYRRDGSRRFLTWFAIAAGISLGLTALVLWWDGELARVLRLALVSDWQPWRRTDLPSIWYGVHGAYRLPVCVLHLALVIITGFWPGKKNLGHVIALSAAMLIGIQFWYADQGGVYVLWYLPLLVLMVMRPNLADRFPPPAPSTAPWPARLVARLLRWMARRIQPPEPAQTA